MKEMEKTANGMKGSSLLTRFLLFLIPHLFFISVLCFVPSFFLSFLGRREASRSGQLQL
jgi:hypothetical protein